MNSDRLHENSCKYESIAIRFARADRVLEFTNLVHAWLWLVFLNTVFTHTSLQEDTRASVFVIVYHTNIEFGMH